MADSFPIDALVGVDEADLLLIKAACVNMLKEGKAVMSYQVGGRTTGKQIVANPGDVLKAARYALRLLDPAEYGGAIVTRTHAGFGGYPQ